MMFAEMMFADWKSRSTLFALAIAAASVLICPPGDCIPKAQGEDEVRHPQANRIISYKVDPNWPQRPASMSWGQMPGIAVDGEEQVWLFTRAMPPVQVYDSRGKFVRAWGEGGVIDTAHFIEIDHQGNIWLADIGLHVVMQFTPEGKLLKTLGTRGEAGNDQTHFDKPTDMAITPGGEVFVSDGYGNSRIVHFDERGRFVHTWGKFGTEPGEFDLPHAIALDSTGKLYVADRSNGRVQVFDQRGKFLDQWCNLIVPWGLWITPADEIWICGSSPTTMRNERGLLGVPPKDQVLMKFAPSGKLLQLWTIAEGTEGQERPGELNWVHGIALDPEGNIYVGDILGKRAQKFVRQSR